MPTELAHFAHHDSTSITFGHADAPGGKPLRRTSPKKQQQHHQPMSLAAFTKSKSSAVSTNSALSGHHQPLPLSAFGFASKAVNNISYTGSSSAYNVFGVPNSSVSSDGGNNYNNNSNNNSSTNTRRHKARSTAGLLSHLHDHDKNVESPPPAPWTASAKGGTHNHNEESGSYSDNSCSNGIDYSHGNGHNTAVAVAAAAGARQTAASMRRHHVESTDHLRASDEGMTHNARETMSARGHSAHQAESSIGDMLGGGSQFSNGSSTVLVPPAPRPHHRAPHSSMESSLVSVDGVLTHAGTEHVSSRARVRNIHSGDCSIGDMLGGVSTVPPPGPKHYHRPQHNTSEEHLDGVLGGHTVKHQIHHYNNNVLVDDNAGTVFGDKPELQHRRHLTAGIGGGGNDDQIAYYLNQSTDPAHAPPPPPGPKHYHRPQHNTSEEHLDGVLGGHTVKHQIHHYGNGNGNDNNVLVEDHAGTVFGDKPEVLHRKHIVGGDQMGFCLNQSTDLANTPAGQRQTLSASRARNQSFLSSGSMGNIMHGVDVTTEELASGMFDSGSNGSLSARKAKYMNQTNVNFHSSMGEVLSNKNGQRAARNTTSGLAAPRKGAKMVGGGNCSNIVFG